MVGPAISFRTLFGWACAAALLVCGQVEAATWKKGSSYVWTGRGNVYEANGPAEVGGKVADIFEPAPGGVYVGGAQPLRLPNYGSVTVEAGKVIPWSNIAKGIGGLSTVGLAIDVGTAVWDWYNSAGVKPVECGPDSTSCHGETQWQIRGPDATTSATVVWVVTEGDVVKQRYAPLRTACDVWANAFVRRNPMGQGTSNYTVLSVQPVAGEENGGSPRCEVTYRYLWGGAYQTNTSRGNVTREEQPWCIDKTGHAVVKPTAGSCPAGTWVNAPWSDVEPKLSNTPPSPDKGPDIWKDIIGKGGEVPDTGEKPSVKGPSQVQGPSSTTTGPNGTTTTSTTYNFTYNQNTVTVTSTTTTTGPNGTTTKTEDVQPEKSQCEENPNTLGCLQPGESTDEAIPTSTRQVGITAEPVALPEGCPAPHVVDTGFLGTVTIEYDLACQGFSYIRPAVLAMAAVLSIWIVVGALRK